MGKYRYLFKNIGLLTLSSFATKILTILLVPLYTNILSTSEYGTYDLFNTTIGVLLPILTLNIHDAVMRFSMEKETNDQAVVTVGFRYILRSILFVLIGLGINHIFKLSSLIIDYSIFFLLLFVAQSLSGLLVYYVRGINRIADLSVSSVIASAIVILSNILFLVVFSWGLKGYFLANIIGPLVQSFYLIIKLRIFNKVDLKKRYSAESKEMIQYSMPLIANSIAWWINNASDKYVVTFFCGLAENGIYSVASKIPSILNVFQTIFNQAWTLSAVKDYDPNDESGFFSKTYAAYNCMLVILCSLIIIGDKIMAKFFYAKDFYIAWRYVPFLTISIIFGALAGYLGGVFTAVKDSKVFAHSTVLGAIINIILNFSLTPVIGALGDAIATAVSFIVVWYVRYHNSKNYVKIKIRIRRDVLTYVVLFLQSYVLLLELESYMEYTVEIVLFVLIIILYNDDIKSVVAKIKNR